MLVPMSKSSQRLVLHSTTMKIWKSFSSQNELDVTFLRKYKMSRQELEVGRLSDSMGPFVS